MTGNTPLKLNQGNLIEDIVFNDVPAALNIESFFEFIDSPSAGTVIAFDTNIEVGEDTFFVELFDAQGSKTISGSDAILTPITVANFLGYVNSGAYDNSFIHRSVSDFVIQGGGFKTPVLPADQLGSDPSPIASEPSIVNESGNSNLRGTIAMAKLSGDPNSATSQFFFNLEDTNSFLDNDNGGFTVFGKVLGVGMEVIDTMSSATTYDASVYYGNGALTDLPLWNVDDDYILKPDDFVSFEDVYVIPEEDLDKRLIEYSVSSSDTTKLDVVLEGGNLIMSPAEDADGTVIVTVTGQSRLGGSPLSNAFSVNLDGDSEEIRLPILDSVGKIKMRKKVKTYELKKQINIGIHALDTALIGTKKRDKITGTSENEILAGFKGKDVLKGGGGADGFLFDKPVGFGKKQMDKILDFDSEELDKILVDKKAFGLGRKVKFRAVNRKSQLKKASRTKVDFIYENKTGLLYFNENGKKSGFGDGGLFAQLKGKPELFADDFRIV